VTDADPDTAPDPSLIADAVTILHRDDRVVVVDKPAGTIVHRGWADDDDPLLQRVRDAIGAWVYPIHRLDRGASGCVVFALDPAAARILCDAFATAGVDKRYLAITRGHPPEHIVLDHPIPRAPGEERVPAVTEIRRLDTFGRYALVEACPKTGRLHQIRRHLKHLACPLIGDVKYGKGEHNRLFRDHHDLHRLALHAASISFTHPDGTRVTVDAPLAPDLVAALASARAAYAHLPRTAPPR
jgi:tRNA pseudouridine65 synthase